MLGFFWFLLPANIFARIPIVIFYGVGIYVLCLTANIYSVAAVRTIALLRAARGVGFVLSLITSFLVFDAMLSLKTEIYYLVPFILLVSFPLYLQGFWSMLLNNDYSKELFTLISGIHANNSRNSSGSIFLAGNGCCWFTVFNSHFLYSSWALGKQSLKADFFPQPLGNT